MDRFDAELNELFQAYSDAIGSPQAGPNFMPRLWEQIEARRNFTFRFRKLTQVFVAAAAATCLLLAGITVAGPTSISQPASYIDALAEAQPPDNLAALGITAEPNR